MSSVKSDVPSLAVQFAANQTPGSRVEQLGASSWRLSLPSGPAGQYRLAQIDDYTRLVRSKFPWRPPLALSLRARASAPVVPGTWGFGFWNDPFSLSMGFSGGVRRFPALPNAAWFFFASPPNYLSLVDDLPACGNLAATFRSPRLPALLLTIIAPALPLLAMPQASSLLRKLARQIVCQDAASFSIDPTAWHEFRLEWGLAQARFFVDGEPVLESQLLPLAPLGLVIWVDNQYFSWQAAARPAFGTLENPLPVWIEVQGLNVSAGCSA